MRVDIATPCFWPEVRRGTERFARELCDGLLARGHEPRLITSHRGSRRVAVEDGLEIVRVRRPPPGPLAGHGIEDHLTHVPLAYRELRRGNADVVQALAPPDALGALRWKARTGRPVVLSFMGIPEAEDLRDRRGRGAILRIVLPRVDAVVALSDAARAALGTLFGVDAVVIPPPVDLAAFAVGTARAAAPTVICAADAAEPRKHIPLLLEAFALVRRERSDARLVLSRPGTATAPGVELADLDDRPALARAYGEAWVSVLPSVGEAFGLVLAEALATGTPVVGRAGGGMADIVDRPEIGRLFDGQDAGALASAILETFALAELPATRVACRRRAEAFSAATCTERYLELYAQIS